MGLGGVRLGAAFHHLWRLRVLPAPPPQEVGGTDIKRLIYSVAGIALLSIAGFFIYQALANSLVYFILPSEYATEPERYEGRIRLGGIVEAESVHYDAETTELSFNIWDGYVAKEVRYNGAPPEMFKENTGVVVVGEFQEETFVSSELLIKHTEVYRPAEGEDIDLEELKDALS